MRQLQKGDQGPRQRDHRRIHLASVLILRTLRKANYRVPEETQASSAQDDRIAAPSDSSPNNGPRLTGIKLPSASRPARHSYCFSRTDSCASRVLTSLSHCPWVPFLCNAAFTPGSESTASL